MFLNLVFGSLSKKKCERNGRSSQKINAMIKEN